MLRALVAALQLVQDVRMMIFLLQIYDFDFLVFVALPFLVYEKLFLINLTLQFLGVCGGHISSLSHWLSGLPHPTEVDITSIIMTKNNLRTSVIKQSCFLITYALQHCTLGRILGDLIAIISS